MNVVDALFIKNLRESDGMGGYIDKGETIVLEARGTFNYFSTSNIVSSDNVLSTNSIKLIIKHEYVPEYDFIIIDGKKYKTIYKVFYKRTYIITMEEIL